MQTASHDRTNEFHHAHTTQIYFLQKNPRKFCIFSIVAVIIFIYLFYLLYTSAIPMQILTGIDVDLPFAAYVVTLLAVDAILVLFLMWCCNDWVYNPLDEETAKEKIDGYLKKSSSSR
jgi:hypothetical protein